jgi:hypothetical protein
MKAFLKAFVKWATNVPTVIIVAFNLLVNWFIGITLMNSIITIAAVWIIGFVISYNLFGYCKIKEVKIEQI